MTADFPKKSNGRTAGMFSHLWWSVFLVMLLFAFGCANLATLTGGPRDEKPPQLDTLASTPNYQTNFTGREIVLSFDEWVELKDAFNQVVVSPALEKRPAIERRKKAIHFRFDEEEVLHDSATYVINFGNAIVDMTEGNPAPIVFVFSTGPFIDSLMVSGKVVDARTGEPIEKVWFLLYENTADSVVRKERPFYFAQTDKSGQFTVRNVRGGRFKAAALLDKNLNYRYDAENELIGFVDTLIEVQPPAVSPPVQDTLRNDSIPPVAKDSLRSPGTLFSKEELVIRLFEEEKKLFLKEKITGTYGAVYLIFSRAPQGVRLSSSVPELPSFTEIRGDTLVAWYHTPVDSSWLLLVHTDSTKTDTLTVRAGLRDAYYERATLDGNIKQLPALIHPDTVVRLPLRHPLREISPGLIQLLEDSLRNEVPFQPFTDTAMAHRQLTVRAAWKESMLYELLVLPGALRDMFGLTNADTIRAAFRTGSRKDYGTISLRMEGLDADMAYVVRLLDGQGQPVADFSSLGTGTFVRKLKGLKPGAYEVEVIEDLDRNGKWTTGNYDARRQPERIMRTKTEELQPNWEVEVVRQVLFR